MSDQAANSSRPAFPFIEVAYVALFFHAIGWFYFREGFGAIDIPARRIADFTQHGDQAAIRVLWAGAFLAFLAASSYQLVRVYLRVIMSDDLDIKHKAFSDAVVGNVCRQWLWSTVYALHYLLRLAAILLLLFIEKSVHERWSGETPTDFFQRWSRVLVVFYALLCSYSLLVSLPKLIWAKSILKKSGKGVGQPWKLKGEGSPGLIEQCQTTFWQCAGWGASDLVALSSYGLMMWISNPVGGLAWSTLPLLFALILCVFLCLLMFMLEFFGPLIEDVRGLLKDYSPIKFVAAFVVAISIWVSAMKWVGSLL
jgi:hypothetical protein